MSDALRGAFSGINKTNNVSQTGQVNVIDPTNEVGTAWSPNPIQALTHRTGGSYFVTTPSAQSFSNNFTLNLIYALPFYVPEASYYVAAGVIITNFVTTAVVRLGAYADGGGYPTDLLYDFGQIPTVTSSGFKSVQGPAPWWLPSGYIWLACAQQVDMHTLTSTVGSGTGNSVGTPSPHLGFTQGYSGLITGSTMPQQWGTTFTPQSIIPLIYIARQ